MGVSALGGPAPGRRSERNNQHPTTERHDHRPSPHTADMVLIRHWARGSKTTVQSQC